MDLLLECKNVSKFFYKNAQSNLYAVKDLSFSLEKGEVLGLVGESGCGKSTLAKLISGLLDADEGQILIKGRDISKLRGKKRREIYSHIQMVFQNPNSSFDPKKTLGYGICEGLKNKKMSKKEMESSCCQMLEECGLSSSFMNKYPHEVSGGECQRAAIARSLIMEPDILICDEATSSLDVTIQKQIMDLLSRLKKERHLSIIFICHNFALVQQFCDRIMVMLDGKIVEEGSPDQIINFPGQDYSKKLIDSVFTME
ncbi:MAG: dipeptide/oligopeptide/nickel ABC transporter ATP-binding protein [Treponemataceae bacterium]|nr:dipeptide/oligopeptide/nickel ABC transporter ATP-binding protein [Treponemataceae bacterium]